MDEAEKTGGERSDAEGIIRIPILPAVSRRIESGDGAERFSIVARFELQTVGVIDAAIIVVPLADHERSEGEGRGELILNPAGPVAAEVLFAVASREKLRVDAGETDRDLRFARGEFAVSGRAA